MVNALLNEILIALGKRKRRLLDGMELTVPPSFFPPVRKRILRELGKDEFERELEEIIKHHIKQQGKGK